MLISDALDEFYLSMEGAVSANTVLWYKNRLKNLPAYLGDKTNVTSVTLHDLRAWRAKLATRTERYSNHPYRPPADGGLSVESLFCHVRAVKRFFKWLQAEEIISKNPALRLEKPDLPKRRVKGISALDRDKIIKQALQSCSRDYAIVLFLADTACRLGGIADLKISNIDFKQRLALLREKGKGGGSERWVHFKPRTRKAIETYLMDRPLTSEDHLFLSFHKKKRHHPLTEGGIYQIIKRLAKRAKVKGRWNPHNWRHGSIRGMLDNGMPLPAASQIAGHSSTKVTGDIYGTFPETMLGEMHDRFSWLPEEAQANGDNSFPPVTGSGAVLSPLVE